MRAAILAIVILGVVGLVWHRRSSGIEQAPRATAESLASPTTAVPQGKVPDFRGMVLRREFLSGVAPAPDGHARAVVMDWSLALGGVTLVAYDDGTTSLYYSSGGGIIGTGTHESVQRAAEAFRAEAARSLHEFTPVPVGDPLTLPPANTAAFYMITDSATLRAGPVEVSRLTHSHALTTLGERAQAVITAVREARPH